MEYKILAPGIVHFNFSQKLANEILSKFKDSEYWYKSDIYSFNNKNIDKMQRTSTEISFIDIDKEILKKIANSLETFMYTYKLLYKIDFENNNGYNMLRYDPGQYFKTHYDGSSRIYRTVSILIYLNPTEYTGGETYFNNFDLSIKPESPSVLFFPSNYPYSHESKEVTSGIKFVIVNWFNDLPKEMSDNLLSYSQNPSAT